MTKNDIMIRIAHSYPESFFHDVEDKINAGYDTAHRHFQHEYGASDRGVLSDLRHYQLRCAILDAAAANGVRAGLEHHTRGGGNYLKIYSADSKVVMTGFCLPSIRGPIRASKYRQELAMWNDGLVQPSLPLPGITDAQQNSPLGAVILAIHPDKGEDQDVPAAIMLAIPYANLRGWHLCEPLETLFATYHQAAHIEQPQVTLVKLRKKSANGG